VLCYSTGKFADKKKYIYLSTQENGRGKKSKEKKTVEKINLHFFYIILTFVNMSVL
jgi:hypothetical protein